MRKALLIALVASVGMCLFCGCSMTPVSLEGTTWERNVFGQGARLEFGTDLAEVTILMALADDLYDGAYPYDYADGEIVFYYPGGNQVCSSGTVEGNVMTLDDGAGSLWGEFRRR